jgi:mRNA interferase MazF
VHERDADFPATGLKTASVIRVTRLAVVASDRMEGALGRLAITRLTGIRRRLADWLTAAATGASPF